MRTRIEAIWRIFFAILLTFLPVGASSRSINDVEELTPQTRLVYGSLQFLTNLSDRSVYVTPSIEYNIAENVYLSGGAFIGFGKGPQDLLDIGSEFGTYPDIYHTSFRYYF